jgi:hypothetical protein
MGEGEHLYLRGRKNERSRYVVGNGLVVAGYIYYLCDRTGDVMRVVGFGRSAS